MIPPNVQSIKFAHRLMAPPAAPHVSGRVIQALVWIPRSTHWLLVLSRVNAEFTWENERTIDSIHHMSVVGSYKPQYELLDQPTDYLLHPKSMRSLARLKINISQYRSWITSDLLNTRIIYILFSVILFTRIHKSTKLLGSIYSFKWNTSSFGKKNIA